MSNELTTGNCSDLTAASPSSNFTSINIGSDNTIEKIIGHQTIYNIGGSSSLPTPNNSFCNIIVLKGNNFSGNCFSILKRRVHIAGFSLSDIYTFPSLFIKSNDGYLKCANANQEFFCGRVTNIVEDNSHFKVYFERRPTIALLQQNLIDVAVRLGITPHKGIDTLDEAGWRIFKKNIYKELTDNGFDLNIY